MMNPIVWLLDTVLSLYSLCIFIYLIVGLLISFDVINRYQPFVRAVMDFLGRLVEPPLQYIRRYIPPAGPIDLSPMVLLLAIQFVRYTMMYLIYG